MRLPNPPCVKTRAPAAARSTGLGILVNKLLFSVHVPKVRQDVPAVDRRRWMRVYSQIDRKPEFGNTNKLMHTSKNTLVIVTAACALAVCQVANATLTISGSVGGAPTGVNRVNFDDLTVGTVTGVTASGPNGSVTVTTTPDAAVVEGTVSGKYAAPYLSGGNGAGFGPSGGNQADGADATPYLTSGMDSGSYPNASVTLTFSSAEKYFGLLWGSVDSYNTLSFYDANNNLVGSVTGSDVLASPNGDQGVNGTVYVNINSDVAFTTVIATSSQYAFEFDNVAYNATPVPEATTMIAGALLLLPFGVELRRRMRKG